MLRCRSWGLFEFKWVSLLRVLFEAKVFNNIKWCAALCKTSKCLNCHACCKDKKKSFIISFYKHATFFTQCSNVVRCESRKNGGGKMNGGCDMVMQYFFLSRTINFLMHFACFLWFIFERKHFILTRLIKIIKN